MNIKNLILFCQSNYTLTHFRLSKLTHTVYPISILGISGYVI